MADYDVLAEIARRPTPAAGPEAASRSAGLEAFADGGKALILGDLTTARAAAIEVRERWGTSTAAPPWLGAVTETLRDGPEPWQLAALFGDPIRDSLSAGGTPVPEGAAGGDADVARMVLASHHGQHRQAVELGEELVRSGSNAPQRWRLAAVLVAESSALGDQRRVEHWFADLLSSQAGRDPFLLRLLIEQVGRDAKDPARARVLATLACNAGVATICGPDPSHSPAEGAGPTRRPFRRQRPG